MTHPRPGMCQRLGSPPGCPGHRRTVAKNTHLNVSASVSTSVKWSQMPIGYSEEKPEAAVGAEPTAITGLPSVGQGFGAMRWEPAAAWPGRPQRPRHLTVPAMAAHWSTASCALRVLRLPRHMLMAFSCSLKTPRRPPALTSCVTVLKAKPAGQGSSPTSR